MNVNIKIQIETIRPNTLMASFALKVITLPVISKVVFMFIVLFLVCNQSNVSAPGLFIVLAIKRPLATKSPVAVLQSRY